MNLPVLETKELHDAKASIDAGMESLMKRMIKQTRTPKEQEEADERERQETQRLHDAAMVRAIEINNAFWWIFVRNDEPDGCCSYHDLEYRAGGIAWWRMVGHDPDLFTLFREMDAPHRARFLERMRSAELPPTKHPMQLVDLATGEYRVAA